MSLSSIGPRAPCSGTASGCVVTAGGGTRGFRGFCAAGEAPNIIVDPATSFRGPGGGALELTGSPAPLAGAAPKTIVDPLRGSPPVREGPDPEAGFGAGGAFTGAVWNIIVLPAPSLAVGGAVAGLEGVAGRWVAGAAFASPAGRITLNVFWHLPQRMVRPCGPMRPSSTR
jgi:hypothetical protein